MKSWTCIFISLRGKNKVFQKACSLALDDAGFSL